MGLYLAPLGPDRHFHYTVESLTKQRVSLSDILERERVGEQRCEIDAAMADNFHQPAHALFPTGTKRRHDAMISDAGGEGFIGNGKLAGVDAETGQRSRGPQAPQGAFKSLLRAECFDTHIGAATGQAFYFRHD